ncbi:hypothetical protein VNI00_013409 [Paramarasmius palmivorus]|uniref:SET domain-containing protein n=1 Tax=Paramarasmius palmivorus TaxID=297713 RepID=A0AAW0BZY6_9AGAR
MKRGFLKTAKAYPKELESSKEIGGLKREKVSVEGYEIKNRSPKEFSADFLDYDDETYVISSQPSRSQDAQLADNPDGWTECLINGFAKRKIVNTPSYPEPLPRPTQSNCYRVQNIPGKGRGLVATKDIKWGDLILAERAFIIIPATMPTDIGTIPSHFTEAQRQQVSLLEMEKVMEMIYKSMPEEYQKAYMDLYNCHTEDGSGRLHGIFRTNAIAISDYYMPVKPGEPEKTGCYCGTFNLSTNVEPHWDSPTFSMHLRAVRDIKKGEELCFSYISDLLVPASSRQRDLRSYGFECTCEACSDAAASDARRKEIRKISEPQFHFFTPSNDLKDQLGKKLVEPLFRGLKLMETEGLQSREQYGESLSRLSQMVGIAGDKQDWEEVQGDRSARNADVDKKAKEDLMLLDMMEKTMGDMGRQMGYSVSATPFALWRPPSNGTEVNLKSMALECLVLFFFSPSLFLPAMKRGFLKSTKAYPKNTAASGGNIEPAKSQNGSHPLFYDMAAQSKKIGGLKRETVSIEGHIPKPLDYILKDTDQTDFEDSDWIIANLPSTADASEGRTASTPTSSTTRRFSIEEIPGKGRGLVATKDIKWSDLIFAERPLIVHPAALPANHESLILEGHFTGPQMQQIGLNEAERQLELLFAELSPQAQAAYKDLWNCHKEDGSGPILGISED